MYVNLSSDSGIFKLINIVGENIALDIIFLIERWMLRREYYPFD